MMHVFAVFAVLHAAFAVLHAFAQSSAAPWRVEGACGKGPLSFKCLAPPPRLTVALNRPV